MLRPTVKDWSRPAVAVVLVGHAALVLLALAWWTTNLGARPAYGDTFQYLALAESLRVDDFRTLFYPLLLRGLKFIAALLGCRLELLVYLLQTTLALGSFAYLGCSLWDVTARTDRYRALNKIPASGLWIATGAFALVVFSQPLVNHFALSVMADSLAASFTAAGVGALIRISTLGDTRLKTVIVGALAIGAAGFMRPEKIYVAGLTLLIGIFAVWWLTRPETTRAFSYSLPQRRKALTLLIFLLLVPGLLVTLVNRATQTPGYYGWPPVTTNVRIFVRTVWPRLAELRPLLSQQFQEIVSEEDASAFDRNYNDYLRMVPLLQQHAGGKDTFVTEASWAAIRYHGREIASTTAMDTLRYAMPLISYPADLALGHGKRASGWTHTRMREARPALTEVYVWGSTAILLIIQIPVALLFLSQIWKAWNQRIVVAIGWLLGASLVSAVLFGLGNGLQNVRYALPACVLVFAPIVWANFVWFYAQVGKANRVGDAG